MANKMQLKLIVMNWLQFAVWGSYLTSMGGYLGSIGLVDSIGWFYSIQGIASIFMPALMGIVADKWIPAQRLLGICHFIAAVFMIYVGYVGTFADNIQIADIFPTYAISVAFYMPTLSLSYSVSYSALERAGLDTVKAFPPIRIFGTIGFIVAMLIVDILDIQHTAQQFFICAAWGICLSLYSFALPKCSVNASTSKSSLSEALGLKAFSLFRSRKMFLFFIFSMCLGVSLQITNGFANPFISKFAEDPNYSDVFFANHANILISLSQMSETFCILLIPFFMKRFGIKQIMLIAMLAWVLRFGLFAIGNPAFPGVVFLILSMIIYGVAFDFFYISGSLFVDKETEPSIRSSAQGLFMLMTNGLGATIGTLSAQAVINKYISDNSNISEQLQGWSISWAIFASYALVVAILFALIFKYKKNS